MFCSLQTNKIAGGKVTMNSGAAPLWGRLYRDVGQIDTKEDVSDATKLTNRSFIKLPLTKQVFEVKCNATGGNQSEEDFRSCVWAL